MRLGRASPAGCDEGGAGLDKADSAWAFCVDAILPLSAAGGVAHRVPVTWTSGPPAGASTQQRAVAGVDELEHGTHVVAAVCQFREPGARFVQRGAGHVQGTVGTLDGADAFGVEAPALEAFAVDAARAAVAFLGDHHERRHVAVDERAHADERMRADAAELMDAGEAAEDDVVANGDMTCQRRVVGEHAVVADDAVVRHVGVGQQPVVVADAGDAAAAAGAAVYGGELAEQVAVTDVQFDALALVLLVLRFAADRAMADEAVVAADAGRAVDAA